jgi:hypothetical protein
MKNISSLSAPACAVLWVRTLTTQEEEQEKRNMRIKRR